MPGEPGAVLAEDRMPGARWFPEVRLSYVDRALAGDPGAVVVTEVGETGTPVTTTRAELRAEVGALAATLRWVVPATPCSAITSRAALTMRSRRSGS